MKLNKKLKSKKILKDKGKVTILLNQKVYTKDEPRYYKAAWEEEKKQLFFD